MQFSIHRPWNLIIYRRKCCRHDRPTDRLHAYVSHATCNPVMITSHHDIPPCENMRAGVDRIEAKELDICSLMKVFLCGTVMSSVNVQCVSINQRSLLPSSELLLVLESEKRRAWWIWVREG